MLPPASWMISTGCFYVDISQSVTNQNPSRTIAIGMPCFLLVKAVALFGFQWWWEGIHVPWPCIQVHVTRISTCRWPCIHVIVFLVHNLVTGQCAMRHRPAHRVCCALQATLLSNSEIYIPRNALAPASLPNLKYNFPKQKYKILKSRRTYKWDKEHYIFL